MDIKKPIRPLKVSKKINRMKMKLLYYPLLIVCLLGCNHSNTFNISEKGPIILQKDSGKIIIEFNENDFNIKDLKVLDKNNNIILNQFFDTQQIITTQFRNEINDSVYYSTYKGYQEGVFSQALNDSIVREVSHKLITTNELKMNGAGYYYEIIENGEKKYNSLSMKLMDSEWITEKKVKLWLKNFFPFQGDLEFYRWNSREKLKSEKIDHNFYLVEFEDYVNGENRIKIDVEILPSKSDTLISSVFTQQVFVKE